MGFGFKFRVRRDLDFRFSGLGFAVYGCRV